MNFGAGAAHGPDATVAARTAAIEACAGFGQGTPKLAVVFASPSRADGPALVQAVRSVAGDVRIVGGTSGGRLFSPSGVSSEGVSVVLLGGDDLRIATRAVRIEGPELFAVVTAAGEIAKAADEAAKAGFDHYTCLVFAPGTRVDGEAFVAAVRKGAGARAQLAGGLTGDDLTFDRSGVLADDQLRDDHVVLVGIFTRKPIGIAARHGWQPIGARHLVTRAEGDVLRELDQRDALTVWLEEIRRTGATPPTSTPELGLFLANRYELGLTDPGSKAVKVGELVIRAPMRVLEDGSVKLSGSIGEGLGAYVMQAGHKDILRASTDAAADASMRARGQVAGALVLSCAAHISMLGDDLERQRELIADRVGAPVGGACVFGEIAKNERDLDAFFNATVVVVAFPA